MCAVAGGCRDSVKNAGAFVRAPSRVVPHAAMDPSTGRMADIAYVALTLALFAVLALLLRAVEKL